MNSITPSAAQVIYKTGMHIPYPGKSINHYELKSVFCHYKLVCLVQEAPAKDPLSLFDANQSSSTSGHIV